MNIRREGDAIAINFAELHKFIWQKRAPHVDRIFVAKEIISAAEIIIAECGNFAEFDGLDTRFLTTDIKDKNISLLYTTPFNKIIGKNYGIDVWCRSAKSSNKVFSAFWEPLDIVRFDRGPWIQDLLLSAYHKVIVE
jgi:hypothetical protein